MYSLPEGRCVCRRHFGEQIYKLYMVFLSMLDGETLLFVGRNVCLHLWLGEKKYGIAYELGGGVVTF